MRDGDGDGWRLVSAHAGLARAYAVLGDYDGLSQHYADAKAAISREPDEEKRGIIASQLTSIPRR